jgi:LacI family transcriptional regulator
MFDKVGQSRGSMATVRKSSRGQKGGATIADVAQESGFSPMTVSRVINGEKNVRESTRSKILDVIEKLHYAPNLAARSLAGAEQIKIGLLYSNPSAAYLSRFLVGSLEQARQHHVQLIIEDCKSEADAREALRVLKASHVDGVILSPPLCDSKMVLKTLEQEGLLSVIVANWRPSGNVSVIRIDDVEAAYSLTKHLLALGHRRIGFIKGNPTHQASSQRFIGYKQALEEAEIAIDKSLVVDGLFTYRSGLEAAQTLLNLSERPTAIFAANDDMAAATVTIAHRNRMDVPKDLTVCGFDDTDFAQSIWPELTTIHQPIADMSRAAVDLLVEHIKAYRNGRRLPPEDRLLDYTFVQRDSDAAPQV